MDVLQEGYQNSRKKIYLTPTPHIPANASHHTNEVFPDIHDNRSKNAYVSAAEVAAQIERFQALIREKDAEILKMKHENILLKQVGF